MYAIPDGTKQCLALSAETTHERMERYMREDDEKERHEARVRDLGCRGWLSRCDVRLSMYDQMNVDLELERLFRCSSGTTQKEMSVFNFHHETYSWWTKIRGCVEHIASNASTVAELEAERDAEIKMACAVPVDAKTASRNRRIVKQAVKLCAREVRELLPEPMRTFHELHWKALRYYDEVCRTEGSAIEFVDTQATKEECTLALDSGMHVLCARYPSLCLTSAALTTAWVSYIVNDHKLRNESGKDSRTRIHAKKAPSIALIKHLQEHRDDAARFPADAVGIAVDALAPARFADTQAHKRHATFALRLLATLPVKLVAVHGDAISARVEAVCDKQLVVLYELLIAQIYNPAGMDMEHERAMAMAGAA